MKYMGSKRAMLSNGLGKLIRKEIRHAKRFVDLFSGSGAVSRFVAQNFDLPVVSVDLQRYSAVLAGAITNRTESCKLEDIWQPWIAQAEAVFRKHRLPQERQLNVTDIQNSRLWAMEQTSLPITQAYGAHYFSPKQAVWIDSLRRSLPDSEPARTVALAALIQAASQSVAAPGHTAQPFQPTQGAIRFLVDAWSRDVVSKTKDNLEKLVPCYAKALGKAYVSDANVFAHHVNGDDLVFIDPPYSGVHYSRFYHVLETIAEGQCGPVEGVGRYPSAQKRPKSAYSLKQESENALDDLLAALSEQGASAILTFPDHECSNGLSGEIIEDIAVQLFEVNTKMVKSTFSTLGGSKIEKSEGGRAARRVATELILVLRPN